MCCIFRITLSQGQIKIDMADSNKHKLAMEAVVKCAVSENKCLITNQYLFAIAPAIQIYYFCATSLVPDYG